MIEEARREVFDGESDDSEDENDFTPAFDNTDCTLRDIS